jgi:hypothetical protein
MDKRLSDTTCIIVLLKYSVCGVQDVLTVKIVDGVELDTHVPDTTLIIHHTRCLRDNHSSA